MLLGGLIVTDMVVVETTAWVSRTWTYQSKFHLAFNNGDFLMMRTDSVDEALAFSIHILNIFSYTRNSWRELSKRWTSFWTKQNAEDGNGTAFNFWSRHITAGINFLFLNSGIWGLQKVVEFMQTFQFQEINYRNAYATKETILCFSEPQMWSRRISIAEIHISFPLDFLRPTSLY